MDEPPKNGGTSKRAKQPDQNLMIKLKISLYLMNFPIGHKS